MFDTLRNNSKIVVYIVVIAFIISGGFMGFGAYLNHSSGQQGQVQRSGVIADVNGQEITQQEYLSLLQQQAPNSSLSSSQIIPFRYNVLSALIERKLVLAQADELKIKADVADSDVQENYDNILKQNDLTEVELSDRLAEQGYSVEQLKADIRSNLETNNIISKTIKQSAGEVNVSDKEIEDLYKNRYPEEKVEAADSDQAAAKNGNEETPDKDTVQTRPALADVKSDLKTEITQKKQNQAANSWLKTLKSEADIEIYDPVLNAYHNYKTGKYQAAADEFSTLTANEDSDNPAYYDYLAQSYQGLNKPEQAAGSYEAGLEKYPENTELRFSYAQYLNSQDKKEAALEQLKEISEAAGDDFMTHYQLFMMYNNLDAKEEAQSELTKIQNLSEKMKDKQAPDAETNDSANQDSDTTTMPAENTDTNSAE